MVHAHQWRERLGVTVLLIHHTNASGMRERGHSAMRGAADFMIEMRPEDDVVKLECSKIRNGPAFQTLTLKLTSVPDAHGLVFRLASDVLPIGTLSASQGKVLAVLSDVFSVDALAGPHGSGRRVSVGQHPQVVSFPRTNARTSTVNAPCARDLPASTLFGRRRRPSG